MEKSDPPKRFPIFCQLSSDHLPVTRGMQIVSPDPGLLGQSLSEFGEIELLRVNQRSVTVLFSSLRSAEQAYIALKDTHRVFYFPAKNLTPGNQGKNPLHRRFFSLEDQPFTNCNPLTSSEESTQESTEPSEKPENTEKKPSDYLIHADSILNDPRTTVMIRNIPNKYTKAMLLQTLDQHFSGQYDFLYLPIDFKNKCNVGYAFINFVNTHSVLQFYEERFGKKWELFNSEKICDLAYAKIQGYRDLVTHFESSTVMTHEDTEVRPEIFKTSAINS